MSDTVFALSLLVIAVKIVIVVVVCCRRAQGGTQTVLPEFLTVTMHKFFSDMEREKPIRFSSEQLMIATSNFTNLLGSGAFGAVYKGIFTNGVSVAVKVLNGSSDKRIEEQFMAEVSTIGRTHHFNLLRLYGFCFDRNLRALVYEFMPNGSLDRFLFQQNKVIEFMKLHDIATGTAKGIAYLHEECQQRIIHYDIKPGNILLDANFTPKVADFGLAKLSSRENTHITMTGGRGTPGYAAPELWMPFPVTQKCDVYSFGMLLFEIIGKRRNLDVTLPDSQEWFPRWVWKMFENGELVNLRAVCSIEEKDREPAERMIKVALWCVQYQPAARPLMSVVVKMLEGGVDIPMPVNPFQHLYIGTSNLVVGSPCPDLLTSGTWTQSWSGPISSNMVAGPSYQNATATPVMRKYEIEIVST